MGERDGGRGTAVFTGGPESGFSGAGYQHDLVHTRGLIQALPQHYIAPPFPAGTDVSAELRELLQSALGATFTIDRELGRGGMSRVFLAKDHSLDREVVVKVLPADASAGLSAERFKREIQVIASLQHPHIIPILSAGSAEGCLYYVMPYVAGETLRSRLEGASGVSESEGLRIVGEILDALAFAHSRGVVHRDIKPENILISAGHAVVADFGVAKALADSGGLTSAGIALGTPAYMAPEQAAADPNTDHRADLYSVGVVAYEVLSGSPPFSGTPQQLLAAHLSSSPPPLSLKRPGIASSVTAFVMRSLAKDPAERQQSAVEMLRELDSVTTTRAEGGDHATTRRRQRLLQVGGAILFLLLAVGLWWWITLAPRDTTHQSVAIIPFTVPSRDTLLIRMSEDLVTTVSASIDGTGDIRTPDAIAVLSNARRRGPLLSVNDGAAIAAALGSRTMLHGTLVNEGGNTRADAVLYDLRELNSPMARLSVTAPRDSLGVLTDSLAWQVLRAIWRRDLAPSVNVSSINTRSPVARREFLDGERLFSRSDIDGAAEAYRRAIAADSTFWFAYYRYLTARNWLSNRVEPHILETLYSNIDKLPERERQLLTINVSSMSHSERLQALSNLISRYPDFVPALVTKADFLTHAAVLSGRDISEAIVPWQEVVRRMPVDTESAWHLTVVCVAANNMECATRAFARLDSLVRADSAVSRVLRGVHRMLMFTLYSDRPGLVDSLIKEGKSDSLRATVDPVWAAPLIGQRPSLMAASDSIAKEVQLWSPFRIVDPPSMDRYLSLTIRSAARGDWRGIDSAIVHAKRMNDRAVSPLDPVRGKVLAELQQMLIPDKATADIAVSMARVDTTNERYDAVWIAATNALLRGDTLAMMQYLDMISSDSQPRARIVRRSLRALREGFSGNRKAAAESLLVIERQHGEEGPKVLGAFAANRLIGAQWLTESGRYAEADSLLRYTRGFVLGAAFNSVWPVFASAQLQRSRIAEHMGRREEAIQFARVFLAVFDKAPQSQRALVEEARQRITRLGGKVDGDVPRQLQVR